jgi:hypothetical protein
MPVIEMAGFACSFPARLPVIEMAGFEPLNFDYYWLVLTDR